MTLEERITYLKDIIKDKDLNNLATQKLIIERLIPSDNFNTENFGILFQVINDFNNSEKPSYYLLFSLEQEKKPSEIQNILDKFLTKIKNSEFQNNRTTINYDLFWTQKAFQKEKKLTGLFFNNIIVNSENYNYDPTKTRLEKFKQKNQIAIITKANKLFLKAEGNYRKELKNLISFLNPQYLKLDLIKKDFQRLLKKLENTSTKKTLEEFSQSFQNKPITLTIPTQFLDIYEYNIGKSLLFRTSKKDSRITKLIKIYNPYRLFRGEKLSDLQILAKKIPQLDLKIFYNHSLLTNKTAKDLLETEITNISKYFEFPSRDREKDNLLKWNRIKEVIRTNLDEDIIRKCERLEVNDCIHYLKAKGYNEVKSKWETEREIYTVKLEEINKEKHLFEFFKQLYNKKPEYFVQKIKTFYQNKKPQIEIFSKDITKSISQLKRLELPSQAKLDSLEIIQLTDFKNSNNISIQKDYSDKTKILFSSKIDINSPTLLPLQEYLCQKIGLNFP